MRIVFGSGPNRGFIIAKSRLCDANGGVAGMNGDCAMAESKNESGGPVNDNDESVNLESAGQDEAGRKLDCGNSAGPLSDSELQVPEAEQSSRRKSPKRDLLQQPFSEDDSCSGSS